MGELQKQMFRESYPIAVAVSLEIHQKLDDHWINKGDVHDQNYNSTSSTSSFKDSSVSNGSISSSSLEDDASSSTSNSSSQSNGPLDDFTEICAELPIKRGLSKFYQGKSQSFTSLSRVESIEDLAKKESPYNKRLNTCKSYGNGLDIHKSYTFKKASRGSLSSFHVRRGSCLAGSRPPSIPVIDDKF